MNDLQKSNKIILNMQNNQNKKIKIIRKNKIWSFEKDKQDNVINWKEDINITMKTKNKV